MTDYGTLEPRFWPKVVKSAGCWEWAAYRNPNGYGTIYYQRRPWLAHRVAWMLSGRPLSEDEELDHLCRNPGCVNPDHLESVSHRENMLRGPRIGGRAAQTHCKRGHPFDEANTARKPDGRRWCRRCHADYENRRYHDGKRRPIRPAA